MSYYWKLCESLSTVLRPDKVYKIFYFLLQSIEEKCVYKVSAENPSWTICERTAWVSSKLYGLVSALEAFSAKRFCSNAQKASLGFDYVLTSLFRADHLKDHPLTAGSKIKETARKAAEIAKSKAAPILPRAAPS